MQPRKAAFREMMKGKKKSGGTSLGGMGSIGFCNLAAAALFMNTPAIQSAIIIPQTDKARGCRRIKGTSKRFALTSGFAKKFPALPAIGAVPRETASSEPASTGSEGTAGIGAATGAESAGSESLNIRAPPSSGSGFFSLAIFIFLGLGISIISPGLRIVEIALRKSSLSRPLAEMA